MAIAALGRLRDALEPTLGLLEVRVQELGLDRLDVGQRVDAPLGVDDVRILVGADDVDDRVGLTDVGQEQVAESLAAMGAGDKAGDVVERDRVGDDLRGSDRLRHRVEPRIGDRDHGDVRLDRRERVVRGLRRGARQRREQGRLAGIGHADDPDLHRQILARSQSDTSGDCTE